MVQVSAAAKSGREEAYSVFGSTLVEILLDFKWRGFARRKYFFELLLYILQVHSTALHTIDSTASHALS